MPSITDIGYAGNMLRVDLSDHAVTTEPLEESTIKKWVGGIGLGARYLYREVPAGVEWSDPENRMIWTTGPLAGTDVAGAGAFNIVTKGPMTNGAGSTQANGFLGAYLKFCGFDGIIFQGQAEHLVYVVVRDGKAEIRDARHLAGTRTDRMEDLIREELGAGKKEVSIFGVGPAGEHRVRFACIMGDYGHAASKNGVGAVMGAKNLKAVVVYRGENPVNVGNRESLKQKAKELLAAAKTVGTAWEWGTGGGFSIIHDFGALPVRNYTTNIFPQHEKMGGKYMRTNYEIRSKPCYRCAMAHVKEVTVTEGPYKGFKGEEPEYETLAAFGPQIGNTELGGVVMLSNEMDALGMDSNEIGWIVGWALECYERGVFTQKDTDGLDLTWGDVEVVKELVNRIALRKGQFANLLADGVRLASRTIGGEAADWAVYGGKGTTPRTHDHRGTNRWFEMMDTCLSNTGSVEASWGGVHPTDPDKLTLTDSFNHEHVAKFNANTSGIRLFDDCLGICRLASNAPRLVLECLNAATGWDWRIDDVQTVGKRIVHQLRLFDLKHGIDIRDERPSARYGSTPVDGPCEGKSIMEKWDGMVEQYYTLMGWDPKTGKPLPETLAAFDLVE